MAELLNVHTFIDELMLVDEIIIIVLFDVVILL